MIDLHSIDVTFDFTSDVKGYWDKFWESDPLMGCGNGDPDGKSRTMQQYHQAIYSRCLPNGKEMCLQIGSGANYLYWDGFRFGSDSIIASFRYEKNKKLIEAVSSAVPNWHRFIEEYIKRSYTLGGEIIFPKMSGGINQMRGMNHQIRDRWDLTLECIRRFYINEPSPLTDVLNKNKRYFELFVDFKGYVDYFFLQDCVTNDYSKVIIWTGEPPFSEKPLPKTVDEYLHFISEELKFVDKRNKRIHNYICSKKTTNEIQTTINAD